MYVFLDFDGVLCTSGTYKRWRKAGGKLVDDPKEYDPVLLELLFDPHCCQNVQQLCDMVDAEVVLSTSWRKDHNYDFLLELLPKVGITAPVIGSTPVYRPMAMGGWGVSSCPKRGDEIDGWLRQREEQFRITIPKDEILILEDEEDVTPYRGRQVKTSFAGTRAGFQQRHLNVGLRLAGWKVYKDSDTKKWVRMPPGETA